MPFRLIDPAAKPYDVLLDDYEKGMTSARLDGVFKQVRLVRRRLRAMHACMQAGATASICTCTRTCSLPQRAWEGSGQNAASSPPRQHVAHLTNTSPTPHPSCSGPSAGPPPHGACVRAGA